MKALFSLFTKLAPYSKAIVALGGVIVLAGKAMSDGVVTQEEAVAVITAIGVLFGVYQVPNKNVDDVSTEVGQ